MKTIIGEENIKSLLFEFLEENSWRSFRSILTGKPLVYYFWEDFAEKFMQTRVEKKILLQSLRLTEQNFDSKKHKNYVWYLKEIKHIPSNETIDWGVVFLSEEKVIVFFTDIMKAEVYEDNKTILNYQIFFQTYWG